MNLESAHWYRDIKRDLVVAFDRKLKLRNIYSCSSNEAKEYYFSLFMEGWLKRRLCLDSPNKRFHQIKCILEIVLLVVIVICIFMKKLTTAFYDKWLLRYFSRRRKLEPSHKKSFTITLRARLSLSSNGSS